MILENEKFEFEILHFHYRRESSQPLELQGKKKLFHQHVRLKKPNFKITIANKLKKMSGRNKYGLGP